MNDLPTSEPARRKPAIHRLAELFMVVALAGMVVAVFVNVVLRYAFGTSIVSYEEISRLLFVWLVAVGTIVAAFEGKHLGFDMLTSRLHGGARKGLFWVSQALVAGCMVLLRDVVGDLTGKRAVVIGRSNLMGKPMAQLLLAADCTVTIAHSRSKDLPGICREADILVAAVGRAEMVRGDWIKPGATVIDVGISRFPSRDPVAAAAGKTRLVGDVAFDEAKEVAGAITPVPGGVGPMTIAMLLANTVSAAKRLNGIAE